MVHNIIAFLPLTVLIVSALVTRKLAESIIGSALLAMLFLYKGRVLSGTIERIYATLSDPTFQFVIIILIGFGGMIKTFQMSGGLKGFGDWVSKFANGKKKPLILGIIMTLIMFADDYLSTMTATFSLRDTTDRNGIPREHLAFQTNSLASAFCVLIPFSSWTAFTIGLISDYGFGFSDYVEAIPLMFYPILITVICLGLDLGFIPKVGALKESYDRVEKGGSPVPEFEQQESLIKVESELDQEPSSAWNVILPLVCLIAGVMFCDKDLIHGLVLAIFCQFLMYTLEKLMTVGEFFEYFFEGARSMLALIIVVCFGFMLTDANQDLGLFDIIIGSVGSSLPAWLLPAVAFLVVGFTTFATGGCWVMQIIAVPILFPLAQAGGLSEIYVLAAIMSGVTMGYATCFYADSMFMTAAGSEVTNLRIVRTSMPYALAASAITIAGYIIIGIFG